MELCVSCWNDDVSTVASNSRPDIAYAVHQCARFTHFPKRSHEVALKRIGRYLKHTRERGMVVRPSKDLQLDLFADADFAGLWSAEKPTDPTCVRSRSGYVITLGGTPVQWASKLQTEIALSTMEAEYISLSYAMRTLLPTRLIIHEMADSLNIQREELSRVAKVHEDNQAALKLAKGDLHKMTPRTKHIAIKYHWFRSHLKPGEIEIGWIDTKQQKADGFTKGLKPAAFDLWRMLVCGW